MDSGHRKVNIFSIFLASLSRFFCGCNMYRKCHKGWVSIAKMTFVIKVTSISQNTVMILCLHWAYVDDLCTKSFTMTLKRKKKHMCFHNRCSTQRSMRISNFCLPGHAGAELVNLPMSLSSVGWQQPVVRQRPRGNKEGAAACGWQQVKQKRREGGRGEERGGRTAVLQK